MIALGWVINLFQRGAASMGRINRIMRARPASGRAAAPRHVDRVHGAIEFRNVWFRYPGTERWVLRDVSFRIEAGDTAGPRRADRGRQVHRDRAAHPALRRDEGQRPHRRHVPFARSPSTGCESAIGVVPQDAFVFSDTIENNIGLGIDEDGPAGNASNGRPASPSCTRPSTPSPTAMRPGSASAASTCRAASASVLLSPGPSPEIPPYSCSTTRSVPWTHRPRSRSSPDSATCCSDVRRWWSATASAPSWTRTRSWSWTTAAYRRAWDARGTAPAGGCIRGPAAQTALEEDLEGHRLPPGPATLE
jgi:hypothetical protein